MPTARTWECTVTKLGELEGREEIGLQTTTCVEQSRETVIVILDFLMHGVNVRKNVLF